jgi:hypothetical protein
LPQAQRRYPKARQKNEKIQSQKNIVSLRWASLELGYRTSAAGASSVNRFRKGDMYSVFRRPFLLMRFSGSRNFSICSEMQRMKTQKVVFFEVSQFRSSMRRLRQLASS